MRIFNSQTRVKIIKSLKERDKTMSELSRELNFSKPTILSHLKILQSEEIVKRIVNGNKFIYYRLSEKGKDILDMLSALILSGIASIVAYLRFAEGELTRVKITQPAIPTPEPMPAGGILPDFRNLYFKTSRTDK
ncbi:MAG TPA: ArsR family transcriptional regulator [Archaeoglobaceae archaeon]|nr:ArsR family transcriptional regulator [Archaeoglobaceae archaeon]